MNSGEKEGQKSSQNENSQPRYNAFNTLLGPQEKAHVHFYNLSENSND